MVWSCAGVGNFFLVKAPFISSLNPMVNQKFEVQVQGLFWAGLVITPINMRVFRFSSVLILK